MDRCAEPLDTGYLLGAAGTLLGGDRSALAVEYAALVQELIAEAEQQSGLPVLKVRLGELVMRGGRPQQKGVDCYLQRDSQVRRAARWPRPARTLSLLV